MSRMGIGYTLATTAIGATIAGLGLVAGGGRTEVGVALGAGVGVVVQVGIFWALFVWALPERHGLAYAIGVGVRLVAVAGMALVGLTAADVPPAPTLFSMVGCLFASTLLEAHYIRRGGMGPVVPGAAARAES